MPTEDQEEDLQNQVPIDIQMGLAALRPGGVGAAMRGAGHSPPQQVPPCYCDLHDEPGKRRKAEPRPCQCSSCKIPLQTNYVDFELCPTCSRQELRCMCCGAGASVASAQLPR